MLTRFLRHVPLKRKLTILTMIVTTFALGLAGVSLAVYDQHVLRRNLISDLSATAQIVGYNSASALSFNDPTSAEQTLSSLAVHEPIRAARIYAPDGHPFATYTREKSDSARLPQLAPPEQAVFNSHGLELVRVIRFAGENIGTICLETDMTELRGRLLGSAVAFVVVLLAAALVAYVIASKLQRIISDPVTSLAGVAARVASKNDYSLRAIKHGDDEVGALIDGFNEMLARIQSRDAELQQAHAGLEKRVADRTSELAKSVSLLNATLNSTTDGIIAVGLQGGVFCHNSRFAAMWGLDAEMMARGDVPEMIECAAGQVTEPVEFRRRIEELYAAPEREWLDVLALKDGRIFERYVHPQKIDGVCVGLVVGFRDVTDQKAAHQALAREKTRLQFIFDSVPMGISLRIVRPDGSSTRMLNDTHLRICGLTREQIDDQDAFRAISHPEDYALQLALDAQLQARDLNRYKLEKRYLRSDGQTVWVIFSRERHDYAEGGHEVLTTIVDISELKRTQEQAAVERARFKFIFDSVPVGIALVVPGANETRVVNPAHERITGVSATESDHVGAFKRATHPDDYPRQRPLLDAFKRGEIDRFILEKRYLHADGRVVWVELARRMFVDDTTGLKQAITTIVDITERKDAEARLADTHRQLLETSRAAGMAEVATGVLHNVGNVLNSVNVSSTLVSDFVRQSPIDRVARLSELLASQAVDLPKFFATDPRAEKIPAFVAALAEHLQREQRQCLTELESLRKNIEHIRDIVAMQQSYAKVSGVSELISVTELIEDAVRMNAGALTRHQITLVRDFQANPTFFVEKHKVLQILVNLVRNAKHACDESGRPDKQLTIRTIVESDRVTITVSDNGVGIPPQNLTRIFSHGFTTKKDGHGFGLHSGALAARELGGALVAESKGLGRGASFSLELPLKLAAKAA